MARIARDATPKRRSARLSNNQPQSTQKSVVLTPQLDAVEERDETPDTSNQTSTQNVIRTPSTRKDIESRLRELAKITTPKTEPRPSQDLMHPQTVHQTTAKAPDSGLKLGFADISSTGRASVASLQNTPSRPRQSLAHTNISPTFQFKFSHEAHMSEEGRKMMESIREDAAKIKEQLRAEKVLEDKQAAENGGTSAHAAARRIAKPTAKTTRFSDVHMAQFKKMDSIENHPSAYRARPGFSRPTAQSLKRSSSKADLDNLERPRTAGKSPSARIPPPVTGRLASTSPFKSIQSSTVSEVEAPAKRLRLEGDEDVSTGKPTAVPRPVSSRLLSPTKASAARAIDHTSTPVKASAIPHSNSVKSVRSVVRATTSSTPSPAKLQTSHLQKPLPPIPSQENASPTKEPLPRPNASVSLSPPKQASSSRIPTMAGLRSILRSPRKALSQNQVDTPKCSTSIPLPMSSQKKVDFTPSVKSRYAVKLAEASPSPAKLDRSRMSDTWKPAIPYDSSAFVVSNDEDWNSEDNDVAYPTLPNLGPQPISKTAMPPVDHTIHAFTQKAKEHGRRESKEFKSIFTTLHPKPDTSSLTSVNTNLNRTDPVKNAARVVISPVKTQQSPSTIRRVRTSEPVKPFEDRIQTVPHGLPGKKRRMVSEAENDKYGNDEDAKENRRVIYGTHVPGAWNDGMPDQEEDEGEKRCGKRARVHKEDELDKERARNASPVKKPSAARELAAKTAKSRKAKASIGGAGAETGGRRAALMSRINDLARPKSRV